MEPRDVPLMWWFSHTRGRRDLLIFRSQLNAAPHFELEAQAQKIWADTAFKHDVSGKWTPVQGGVANDMAAEFRGDISPFAINGLIVKATLDGLSLTRLAIHRGVPNLEVHFLLPKFEQTSAFRLFTSLQRLSEEISSI